VSLQTWLWFCATETVLSFLPGPAVLLVISTSLTRGSAAGLAGALGILTANAVYFALSATSLGALLIASYRLFLVIKWAGAAYLVWVGARMIFVPDQPLDTQPVRKNRSRGRSFSTGFITQSANPKALLFFTAILPQFIDPRGRVAFQVAVLGVSSVTVEFIVLGLYVLTCQRARAWAGESRFALPLQRTGGALLIAAGVRLAAIRKS
jgi:homoserine/homoserine lactone efflux protein